jgi:hypothetical protein
MDKNYKNIILTNHALERLGKRSVSIDDIWKTIKSGRKYKQADSTSKFVKTIQGRKIHAVATYLPKDKKWLVVSAWVRGEDDKLPLMWQIIVLPFKIIWWIIKKLFQK